MSNVALQVEGLGKKYRIGQRQAAYSTFRERISAAASGGLRKIARGFSNHSAGPDPAQEFWALRDVSFEIKHGEVVGIIGRNGAGKSTLLKILSRITEPTEGRVQVFGRVGSLLEVGTGFHPELTGRENIYMNGAILGMSKAEIDRKFDEIVAFAEVEKFLDTPVKRYSSGMQLRLGFAVAAYLDPEILIVDEVLAVGDAAFQRKCMGKLGAVAQGGRTVLFVSHNMQAIRALCSRACVLSHGKLLQLGETHEVVGRYLRDSAGAMPRPEANESALITASSVDSIRFLSFRASQPGATQGLFRNDRAIEVAIECELSQSHRGLRIGFDLQNREGVVLYRSFCDDHIDSVRDVWYPGRYVLVASIPECLLQPGGYSVLLTAGIHMMQWITRERFGISFEVVYRGGPNAAYHDGRPGVLMPLLDWRQEVHHLERI